MMDSRVNRAPGLTPGDQELLRRVAAGLPITADVSRADVLLCVQHSRHTALVALHAIPNSISSLYRKDATGRILTDEEQPLLFQALRSGSGGRRQREVLSNGAPIIQDVFPIHTADGRVAGALVVETNLIAHERQRRRSREFRRAMVWLQEMCARGELASAEQLGAFTLYDGIYLVDHSHVIIYMSGIAANLLRGAGITPEVSGQLLTALEPQDIELVERTFVSRQCQTLRYEAQDGRIWVRLAIPLRIPSFRWRAPWLPLPRKWRSPGGEAQEVDAVMVLLHNATDAVQKQRELNVKSAIIQEVHHRVKNNLQNIAAILRMQARRCATGRGTTGAQRCGEPCPEHVGHPRISEPGRTPAYQHSRCLPTHRQQVTQVSGSPDQEINIQVTGTNIRLPPSQATPTAMVVNELLLNAVEHGLAGRDHGTIRIHLDDLGDLVRITIADDGHGLPPDFDPVQHSSSLGLHIVHTLVTDDLKAR